MILLRAWSLVLAIIAAVFVPAVARAQSNASADRLIEEGIALRERDQNEPALEKFRGAYERSHSARALAQIALAEQALGRWSEAERHLDEALRSHDRWIEQHRRLLRQELERIATHIAIVEVTGGTPGATVRVNGAPAGSLPLGAPLRVSAGHVVVEIDAGGGTPFRRELDLEGGAHERVDVELGPGRGSESATPEGATSQSASESSGGGVPVAAIVVLAAGGAVLAGAAVTGALALSAQADLDEMCGGDLGCPAGFEPTRDEGATLATVTDIGLALGAVTVGAGIALLFLLDGDGDGDRDTAARYRPTAACDAHGCGAAIEGRF